MKTCRVYRQRTSLLLPSRYDSEDEMHASVPVTDGGGKLHFSQIMGLFLMLVMHRRLK